MKKGTIAVLICLAFAVVALAGSFCFAGQKIEEVITIYDPVFKKHKKPAVVLHHVKHSKDYGVACTDCHHVYKDGKNTWKEGDEVQKCSACHTKARSKKKDNLGLYEAFHGNCRDCHKELKKKGNKKVSTKCASCHTKKM